MTRAEAITALEALGVTEADVEKPEFLYRLIGRLYDTGQKKAGVELLAVLLNRSDSSPSADITAIEQRGHDSGAREMWEVIPAMCPSLEYSMKRRKNDLCGKTYKPCAFDTCPLTAALRQKGGA